MFKVLRNLTVKYKADIIFIIILSAWISFNLLLDFKQSLFHFTLQKKKTRSVPLYNTILYLKCCIQDHCWKVLNERVTVLCIIMAEEYKYNVSLKYWISWITHSLRFSNLTTKQSTYQYIKSLFVCEFFTKFKQHLYKQCKPIFRVYEGSIIIQRWETFRMISNTIL